MTEELDKLEAALDKLKNAQSLFGFEQPGIIYEAARAHLAAQRQAVNAGIPDVNEAVYGYLDKKALKANERERDLLAGFYFYLQECGFLAAQRQAPADSAEALINSVPVDVILKIREVLQTAKQEFNGAELDLLNYGYGDICEINSCYDALLQLIDEALRELEPWVKGVEK